MTPTLLTTAAPTSAVPEQAADRPAHGSFAETLSGEDALPSFTFALSALR